MSRARTLFTVFLISVGGLFCSATFGQSKLTENTKKLDAGTAPGNASIEDVAWLTGTWRGEGLGGICEEVWSPPLAGGMVGSFRLIKNDKLEFSEFFMLVENENSLH